MMVRHGWTNASQVRVYAHISNRDVDEKDLLLHGLKPASEAQEPLIETRRCPKCQAENAPVAIYCQGCGAPISEQSNEEVAQLREEFAKLKGQFETWTKLGKFSGN